MVSLLLLENDYKVDQNELIELNGRKMAPINFVRRGKCDLIPPEIIQLLTEIQMTRNTAVHTSDVTYSEAIVFLRATYCFIQWFENNSVTLKYENDAKLRLFSRIQSFQKSITIFTLIRNNKEAYSFSLTPIKTDSFEPKIKDQLILQYMKSSMDAIHDIQNGISRIEKILDELSMQVKKLSIQISDFQSLVTKQLDYTISEEAIEKIISGYAEECSIRLVEQISKANIEKEYSVEKEKLILSLDTSAWNKLDESSKDFLITAKITYNTLLKMKDIVDYSGVCILVTKAIETEMKRRFYNEYMGYLKRKYPEKNNYKEYPTSLLNKFNKPVKSKDFTLV